MDYNERIVRAPGICGGAPVFKGTRVLLRTILASLAAGDDPEEILKDFPTISMEDIRAAIAFAAAAAVEDMPYSGVPKVA